MSALRTPRRPWHSLKLRLALLGALLIALAVALSSQLALSTLNRHSETLALDLALAHTRKLARNVALRLVDLQLALRNASMRQAGVPREAAAAHRFLEDRPVLEGEFETLFVADATGRVLAGRRRGEPLQADVSIADRAYFRQTIEQRAPVISEPLLGRTMHEPIVTLTLPLFDADGSVAAVFGGTLRLATHRLLAGLVENDEDDPARTVVVDAQGRIVAHPQREWLLRRAADEPTLAAAVARWSASGRPAEPSGSAASLDGRLVTWAGVAGTDWVVFRSAGHDAVLGEVTQARRRAWLAGALVASAGGGALLLLTVHMLAPLRRLERVAATIARGDTPAAHDWPRAHGEIGDVVTVLRRALEERAAADADGRRLLAQLQAVMLHAPVGFAITRERRFEMVSAQFERLLGHAPGQLDGEPPRCIYAHDADYQGLAAQVAQRFAERRAFDAELEFMRRDGAPFWGRLQGQPVHWDDSAAGTIWTLEDVTRARAERETLAWASSHDALTRLTNRAEFERRLARRLADRRQREACVLFIDLDRFKAVNDQGGHAAGDAMLVTVARTLEAQVRAGDTVARLGGDEFAVLLDGCASPDALRVAEKMRAAVDEIELAWEGRSFGVGASIGVVTLDASWADSAAAMAAADAACYAAKRSGRNSVHAYPSREEHAAV